jgi:glyoxylase-like metal-dependent hydrolase (beta-lactamase superfamily II)
MRIIIVCLKYKVNMASRGSDIDGFSGDEREGRAVGPISRVPRMRETVSFGEQTLEVLHCPGHTLGHVVFFHGGLRLALVRDALFQGLIGRTDFPRGKVECGYALICTRSRGSAITRSAPGFIQAALAAYVLLTTSDHRLAHDGVVGKPGQSR